MYLRPDWVDEAVAGARQAGFREEAARHRLLKALPDRHADRPPAPGFGSVCLATAAAYVRRDLAYAIDVIRMPVYPLLFYLTMLFTYRISGRESAGGVPVEGFLLVGTIGVVLWQSNLWDSGYAIEWERQEGTLPALLLTPASRPAVVLGYALGSFFVGLLPLLLIVSGLAVLVGAHFEVRDPLAVALAASGLLAASTALGYAMSGLFVLTRRANLLANFLQSPIYLLSGMVVPVAALPGPLRAFAEVFPISFGMSALRQTLLSGAGLGQVAGALIRVALMSAVLAVVGTLLLRRVEHAAKRGAEMDYS